MYDRGGYWVERLSGRGNPYRIWVPAMPLIDDVYLKCVVYLYPTRTAAEKGARAGGSGFLFGLPVRGYEEKFIMLVVTNRHVIKKNASTTIRINTKDDELDYFTVAKQHWIPHESADIAITALEVERDKYHNIFVMPRDLLDKKTMKINKIGPGDDCFMVGRFINHEGIQKNTPSVRFGNIAQMPGETIPIEDGPDQEAFLVEGRSVPGYSGSPVFVEIRPFSHGAREINSSSQGGPWLLGIDFCHLNVVEQVFRKSRKGGERDQAISTIYVRGNSGMMGVIPAWKLKEMFDYPDIESIMERAIEEIDEESLASLD